jgi:primosomal protein N' (replication factor Y)
MNLVNVVIPPLATSYTYTLPDDLATRVGVGSEVEVPLGTRHAVGYVVQPPDNASSAEGLALKSVSRLRRPYPLFVKEQLEFFEWVANYYADSLSSVIETAVPPPVPQKFRRFVSLIKGWSEVVGSEGATTVRGKVEKQVMVALSDAPQGMDTKLLASRIKGSAQAVKRLLERNILSLREEELLDQHLLHPAAPEWAKASVVLSEAQNDALQAILVSHKAKTFTPFLLHGITGSGKTEVYIEAAREVLASGRGVLVIVPEIALTPQLIDRFRARLGNDLAVLHSGLHPRTRWDGWRALLEGRCRIGIGARSAVFAPVKDLGLIIVDEEHDSSYKQQEGLRYHARDLALVRGKMKDCPVILGTATPSLETFAHASSGRYQYLHLRSRPGTAQTPSIRILDLNQIKPWEMKSRSVTPDLFEALSRTLEAGNQAFILYNRRGFASYLQCERCENVVKCPNCSVTLTYHKNNHSLVCHYCGIRITPPSRCSSCTTANQTSAAPAKTAQFQQRGSGTERVYDELQELFPLAQIARLDRDAVTDEDQYRKILDEVRSGKTQILVGTQMIAKGHDLPGVTLVGVVDCDVGLHMPDFRAGERVFQLLTQVAGRAGRAEKAGEVLLQTRVPKHPSIVFTQADDYLSFARAELITREALRYPPYTRMLRIVVSSSDRAIGAATIEAVAHDLETLRTSLGFTVQVLGPTPAPIEKIKTLWRWHLLVKATSAAHLNRLVRELRSGRRKSKAARIVFDIDPQEML